MSVKRRAVVPVCLSITAALDEEHLQGRPLDAMGTWHPNVGIALYTIMRLS